MKKLLLVLAIGAFVACNNSGSADAPKTDSPAVAVDTTAKPVDTTAAAADTTAKAADTTAAAK